MQKNLSGSIALTRLKSALITTKKGSKAIVIPIDENFLSEKDGAVYMNLSVIVRDEQDQYGQNGFISQKMSTEKYKELGADAAKEIKLPILGNIKDFGNYSADSSGATLSSKDLEPQEDDLPF